MIEQILTESASVMLVLCVGGATGLAFIKLVEKVCELLGM